MKSFVGGRVQRELSDLPLKQISDYTKVPLIIQFLKKRATKRTNKRTTNIKRRRLFLLGFRIGRTNVGWGVGERGLELIEAKEERFEEVLAAAEGVVGGGITKTSWLVNFLSVGIARNPAKIRQF